MLKQIFRTTLPNDTLFNLLDKINLKTDNYYLIDMSIITYQNNFILLVSYPTIPL